MNFGDMLSQSVMPAEIDTFKILGYTPTKRQEVFHEASRPSAGIFGILYGGAAGGGKAQNIHETLTLTPDGFKKFGDIHPGDTIFGSDGKPIKVLFETDVRLLDSYRLTFDDGSTTLVNDEHLWLTYDAKELAALTRLDPAWRGRRRAGRESKAGTKKSAKFSEAISKRNSEREYLYKDAPTGTVRTTAEIMATLKTSRGRNNHAVPVCSPIHLPEREFSIEPYLLGAWLGDGFSRGGAICGMDEEIFQNCVGRYTIKSRTVNDTGCHQVRYDGLTSELRHLGLINNKHIPREYLMASESQRLALLQGLMDTDGNCLTNGTVEFVNTNQSLTEAVAFLARSLGHKVSIRTGVGKLYGKECAPTWKVKFRAKVQVFRLTRKVERLEPLLGSERRTTNFRYIVSAEYVGKTEMKCITVDALDHLYLTGESLIPTHNSCALLMDAIRYAANYPNIRIGCVRKSYPELEESFIAPLLAKWHGAKALGAKWNGTKKMLIFPNGSVINFLYAETIQDVTNIQGGEYQAFYIDEGALMLPAVIQQIQERLRSADRLIPVVGIRISSNPGGSAHKYLKDRFITPTKKGVKKFAKEEIGHTGRFRKVAFLTAKVDDNPYLDENYTDVLDSIEDPQRRKAMRDGDWDAMVGQFFCLDSETEILTADGWRTVSNISVGQRVATMSPAGIMTMEKASNVNSFHYDGLMLTLKNSRTDFMVTPNHRMLLRKHKSTADGYNFVEASTVARSGGWHFPRAPKAWLGQDEPDTIIIDATSFNEELNQHILGTSRAHCVVCGKECKQRRKELCDNCYRVWMRAGKPQLTEFVKTRLHPLLANAKQKSFTFDRGDWYELVGWYLSEGSIEHRQSGVPKAFRISQSPSANPENVENIRLLLKRMGLKASWSGHSFQVTSILLASYFDQFGRDNSRYIPRWMLDGESKNLSRLFESLILGDGHTTDKNTYMFSFTSKQLSDDIQELAARMGRSSSIRFAPQENPNHHDQWWVYVHMDDNDGYIEPGKMESQHYVGDVGCVTVEPYHTILTRRNGRMMWTGNSEWSSLHVVRSWDIPKMYQRYCGIDWGWSDPFAAIWVTKDPDGRMWAYRELYSPGLLAEQQASYILEAERAAGETTVVRVADPSMWAHHGGTPLSIADQYGQAGCGIYEADNDRPSGWALCHKYLADGPACFIHAAQGKKICPMFHVFEDTCPMFVETVPVLTRSKIKPEDADTDAEDHIADAWRYVCMAVGTYATPIFYDDDHYKSSVIPAPENESQPVARPLQTSQMFSVDWSAGAPTEER